MKCALVIPPWVPEEIFSGKTAISQINYWQPLGTLYVASVLMQAGHDVKFINGAFLDRGALLEEIRGFGPDVVGLYSTTFGWKKAVATADDIKTLNRDIFVVVGGPYPIAMKGACLADARSVDAVVTGEGEYTMLELLDRLKRDVSLEGLEGLAFRNGLGDAVENPPRPLITDLDALPYPARHLLGDKSLYMPPPATYRRKPVSVMITSRGCNRRCLFCFQIDRHRKLGVRFRSVENVIGEIEHCLAEGYREIKFLDDTLAANYDRAMDIAGEIKRKRLDFSWFASACVNQVDERLLREFKDAGCWAVLFGAESGVQKNLNAIKKGITLEQTVRAVHTAKKVGLKVFTPFLFGIPGETFDEGLETIDFACRLNPDGANFHAITPFPGTELWENIDKYGTVSGDLFDYTYQGVAFTPHSMTREQVARLRQIAFRRFYSRPSFLVRRLLSLRTPDDVKVSLKSLKSLFWLWTKKDIFIRR